MMNTNPLVLKYNVIELRLDNLLVSAKLVNIDTSVDLDRWGNPIGVEFINLELNTSNAIIAELKSYDGTIFKFTHDDECDASYIRFSSADSVNQVPASTMIQLDMQDNVVGIITKYSLDMRAC